MRHLTRIISVAAVWGAFGAHGGDREISFNRDIRPIFSDTCFACHGFDAKTRKADLRMDTPEGATMVRTNGLPAITPGDPAKSEAWLRLVSTDPKKQMPPPEFHKTLSDEQKATIRKWIEQGAKYQKHWAFEPPVKATPPDVDVPARTPLDRFIAARLKKEGLAWAPEAPPEVLIRRVAFTLTGLPPTPAEVEAYRSDTSPDAYEKMVDRYLASPRYGEEMARHWLDVVRYADTHGFHFDNEREMWAYRDWVIKAFNLNQRYDAFTVDQLAGDLVPSPTRDQLIATGMNRCNETTNEGGVIPEEFLYRYAVDRATTTAGAWLGLTVGCSTCHDHKFDPLSMKDFYSFYAFFNSGAEPIMDGNAMKVQPMVSVASADDEKKLAELDAQAKARQKELEDKAATVAYTDPATIVPKPPASDSEDVWLEDSFPEGAKLASNDGRSAEFVTSDAGGQVLSGRRSLKRSGAGLGQDFYNSGAEPLEIPQNGRIFANVFLDPKNPPKAIMLQFHKDAWNRRAIWGDYAAIPYGKDNTTEKVQMGALPEAGKWVRIEVPVAKLDLKPGDKIEGFAITQSDGTAYWDKIGAAGRSDPSTDPRRSLLAWRKSVKGKAARPLPDDIENIVKGGAEARLSDADQQRMRGYYLANICVDTKHLFGELGGQVEDLKKRRADLERDLPGTYIYNEMARPREAFVMIRGQYDNKGEPVQPGTFAVLPPLQIAGTNGRASRLDLARWLVAPEHPLTARVTVNRFWQQFFGIGLVKTSGDFGSQGEMPVNPELLDWLAVTFRESGWDVKALARLLLTSTAFRQSSRVTPELARRDPENRLLARGPRFRLDAEQIRDNALYVSGLLDLTMGGRGVKPYQPPNIWEPVGYISSNTRNYKQDTGSALYRRSIYCFLKRTAPPPFMANFDAPSREQYCTRRGRSNTPLQALHTMNDVQHFEAARVFAERMLAEGGATPEDRIAYAYRAILARAPDAEEVAIVKAQLASHEAEFAQDVEAAKRATTAGESKPKPGNEPVQLAAYTLVANMILNLDETLNRN